LRINWRFLLKILVILLKFEPQHWFLRKTSFFRRKLWSYVTSTPGHCVCLQNRRSLVRGCKIFRSRLIAVLLSKHCHCAYLEKKCYQFF
jgi:hypothetical protein